MKKLFPALFLSLLLAGCSQIVLPFRSPTASTPAQTSPTATDTGGLEETLTAEAPSSPLVTEVVTPILPDQSPVLKVWLPPQFDPNAGTPAGEELKARLQAFTEEHPGITFEVRIKAIEGPGGLLESLVTASAAAPSALPDLVALSRPLLEKAALKGLVYSFDGLTAAFTQADWYGYAQELGYLQQSTFGLPFAGDALVLVYQPSEGIESPKTWGRVQAYPGLLGFPASDSQALFTLAQYQAAGGKIQDEQGRPALDAEILVKVLSTYSNAVQAGRVSDRLSQFSDQEQVWQAFQEGQFSMAVTWASAYLNSSDTNAILIPTPNEAPYTLATGWTWALASPQAGKRGLGADLAEFLVESEFLAHWSEAGGFLPPRLSALELWQNEAHRILAQDLSASAHLAPSADILSSLGPALQQAVLHVLRQEMTASDASQLAAQSLGNP